MAPLTDNDVANLNKIAQLRGYAGALRNAIVSARNVLLRYEHATPNPGFPIEALHILSNALERPAP